MQTQAAYPGGTIPETAWRWANRTIGPFEVIRCCRQGSRRTGVWEIASSAGRHYLKLNRRRARWATELYVYRNWVPHLAPFVPRLEGVLDEEGLTGLLLSSLDGVPLREASVAESDLVKAYAKAGELCAQLQGLCANPWFGIPDELGRSISDAGEALAEPERDPICYYRRCITDSLAAAEAAGAVTDAERAIASDVLASLPRIAFPQPVPTSFDYTPGNWVVDGAGQFRGLIDFENMAWGLAADPFARLVVDYFPRSDEARDAFYGGYGSRPPEDQREQVRIGCLLYALLYKTLAAGNSGSPAAERAERAFAFCRD